ncbi:hypothetical protein LEP1GSC058_0385 [Leptospira fainei serovar Hurstbridge str. BUT 6]|uniref:Uncharacterized protein n=1 Tax=Leptospira fainei serovar Hurstbridge str. BUT 6 TaxID=1193011 RepID=S3V2X2_9LEPT|nr:hypothetical protein LEP1GSC058_0385 [Leptospira fainei serovar Hurstbridge str. BUT 6]
MIQIYSLLINLQLFFLYPILFLGKFLVHSGILSPNSLFI